eukprot:CAMPEP_0114344472 /NCGR_PEP_ID=MMETSP0101-20121206/11448_1 /TAXON_ID=38822 ORGANISM="Pteridomonas danica, Strain PT" /NCGR_SAMPLE_ID=MMETSP0101 /ASSEMBLY_ACC=CAM_ASM_000211 /LENGTH=247 /DNA_ID=CAMNT_0001479843 /DNA_START=383 /DNA_END=1126 /DNA_ORIENTATION=+
MDGSLLDIVGTNEFINTFIQFRPILIHPNTEQFHKRGEEEEEQEEEGFLEVTEDELKMATTSTSTVKLWAQYRGRLKNEKVKKIDKDRQENEKEEEDGDGSFQNIEVNANGDLIDFTDFANIVEKSHQQIHNKDDDDKDKIVQIEKDNYEKAFRELISLINFLTKDDGKNNDDYDENDDDNVADRKAHSGDIHRYLKLIEKVKRKGSEYLTLEMNRVSRIIESNSVSSLKKTELTKKRNVIKALLKI